MSEAKDPAIKLFGKTIPVTEIPAGSGDSFKAPASSSGDAVDDGADQNHASSSTCSSANKDGEEEHEIDWDTMGEKLTEDITEDKKEDRAPTELAEEVTNLDTAARLGEESVTPFTEKEATALKTSRTEEEQGENPQEKTLKKPDKILPCPRCNSMDTKFCYYNNYNVNQPRHFCKNCQRYWTAGGAMRNVPVGAGRRKNKNSSSHYHHITVSEAVLQNPQSDLPNGVHHPSLKCGEKGNDHSTKSSVTSTKPMEGSTINKSPEQVMQNFQSLPPQVPYFPGAPWPFPWNPAQWSSLVPSPAFFPPGFAIPFYPTAAYWGCTMPGAWNMNIPWLAQPSSPNSTTPNSGPNSPTLGKHSREENMAEPNDAASGDEPSKENNKKCLWVPKTLRIDDLGEAAKSSIWTTLGIKNDKTDSIHGGGLFKAFPSKGNEKNHVMQNSSVLQANPAALSRSINFHESS